MTERVALIVGAGIAGLSAAWWLSRSGWRPIIIERADSLREGGYMIGLSGPGYETAGRMGLRARLEAVSCAIHENVYRDRKGREILRLRYRDFLKDLPFLALLRTDLVRVLAEALGPAADIRFGKQVLGLAQDGKAVTATLSDGSSVQAEILIGADGLRSQIRREVFGKDATVYRHLGYRFATYDLADTLALGHDFLSYAEPGHLAEYYGVGGDRLAALQIWRDGDTHDVPSGDRWALLERVAAHSHPHVREILATGRGGPAPLIDTLTLIEMPAWSKGRVTLIGDAAHCLTLVSGQGAGMAMTSAEILSQELARRSVSEAFAAHEERLRPAIARLQLRSRRMASVFIPQSATAFLLRNFWMRHLPRRWLGRYFLKSVRSEIALAG